MTKSNDHISDTLVAEHKPEKIQALLGGLLVAQAVETILDFR